jgi:outer membrane protein assembly factor BamD
MAFVVFICAGLIAALGFFGGCASSLTKLKGAEYYLEEGKKSLDKKRCLKAIESFQRIVNNFPGSSIIADAQYYLGESYFCNQDYIEAIFEYQRLVDIYSSSQWLDEAQYQIGEAHYQQLRRAELDQKETREALVYFYQFIDDNPTSPLVDQARARIVDCRSRLAKKLYQAGELYLKQKHLEAAKLTFNDLILSYPDTPWYFHGVARLGEVYMGQGDEPRARAFWDEVLLDSDDEKLKKQVQKLIDEADVPTEE